MEHSNIEWCDHTFKPWEGCQKVGTGCDHCYAEIRNARFSGGRPLNCGPGAPRRHSGLGIWRKPPRWQANASAFFEQHGRRQRVFCASLADWLDKAVPALWRLDLLRVMFMTPDLDWLLLTKRIGNLIPMVEEVIRLIENQSDWSDEATGQSDEGLRNWLADWVLLGKAPSNVQIGATITSQEEADRDVCKLLDVPARVHFLSMEPLLGPVDLTRLTPRIFAAKANALTGKWKWQDGPTKKETPALDWVIVGGESGPGARPMHPDWALSLRDQCSAAGVPFFFKQWGEWKPISQMPEAEHAGLYVSRVKAKPYEDQSIIDEVYGRHCKTTSVVVHMDGSQHSHTEPMAFLQGTSPMTTFKVGKKASGRLLDGVEYNQFPALPRI